MSGVRAPFHDLRANRTRPLDGREARRPTRGVLQGKITSSLQKACQKRPVSEDDIAGAVERIQDGLVEGFDRETTSRAVGERVMRELRKLDPVAYVRFASIYRNFEEATDFVSEVERLGSLPIDDKRQLELIAEAEALAKGGAHRDRAA